MPRRSVEIRIPMRQKHIFPNPAKVNPLLATYYTTHVAVQFRTFTIHARDFTEYP